jgi:hypothetical protein
MLYAPKMTHKDMMSENATNTFPLMLFKLMDPFIDILFTLFYRTDNGIFKQ